MTTLTLGQEIRTPKSGIKGVVKEIVQNANGSVRVRLETKSGAQRWTTIQPEFKVLSVSI